jgi:hypothetical protein
MSSSRVDSQAWFNHMHVAQHDVAEFDMLHCPRGTNPHLKIASDEGVRFYVNIRTLAV